jgi:hypothetical protein
MKTELPDGSNLFGALRTELARRDIANLFVKAGWSMRNSAWDDYELTSTFAELILEADAPILLHGSVEEIETNALAIASILEDAGIEFVLECHDTSGVLLTTLGDPSVARDS